MSAMGATWALCAFYFLLIAADPLQHEYSSTKRFSVDEMHTAREVDQEIVYGAWPQLPTEQERSSTLPMR